MTQCQKVMDGMSCTERQLIDPNVLYKGEHKKETASAPALVGHVPSRLETSLMPTHFPPLTIEDSAVRRGVFLYIHIGQIIKERPIVCR